MLGEVLKAALVVAAVVLASDLADNVGTGYGLQSLADAIVNPGITR